MIDDIQLGVKAKQLVDAVETAGVLAKGADRLSSEQLARYFIRAFKDKQLGMISASRCVETPSRHLHESSSGEEDVGGLFVDFGPIRAAFDGRCSAQARTGPTAPASSRR